MSGEAAVEQPAWHKAVGISLAVSSAVFIGTSFIVKKKGLIDSGKQERQRRASQQQQEMMDTGNAISVNDMGFVGVNCEELKAGLGLVDDSATSVVRVKEITSSVKDSHAYLYNKLWWTGMILSE